MRNSTTFWEKTARVGELCWVRRMRSGYRFDVGIVVNIDNFSYWAPNTYQDWVYHILIGDTITTIPSYYVEKIPYECSNGETNEIK